MEPILPNVIYRLTPSVTLIALFGLAACSGFTPPTAAEQAAATAMVATVTAVMQTTPPAVVPTSGATGLPTPTVAPADQPTASATLEPPVTPGQTLDSFIQAVELSITERDFTAMQALMSDPFAIGYWRSEGVTLNPAEAAAEIERSLLPANATITFNDPGSDISAMLDNQPAEALVNGKKLAATLLSRGWGQDGRGEAILFITEKPEGGYTWDLLLFAGFGFMTAPTTVTGVTIVDEDTTLYSGPGESFPPVATVAAGLPYPVIGASDDGRWWRLTCFDEENGLIPSCWVSADPAVSQPSELP